MVTFRIILESNSNKKLDAFAKEVIFAIKCTGAVKAGPIPFKGKRLIYCYNANIVTIDSLIALKQDKKVTVTVETLENPQ